MARSYAVLEPPNISLSEVYPQNNRLSQDIQLPYTLSYLGSFLENLMCHGFIIFMSYSSDHSFGAPSAISYILKNKFLPTVSYLSGIASTAQLISLTLS